MNETIKTKIAIGVGYNFVVANSEDVKGIALEGTGINVEVGNQVYPLYKGTTFGESRKIDEIMDSGKYTERKISAHRTDTKRNYDVTVTRFGCVQVEAHSSEEAIEIADSMKTDEITWSEDWEATDAVCEGEVD